MAFLPHVPIQLVPYQNHVISDTSTEDGLSRGYLKEICNCKLKYNAIKQNTSILIRVMVQYVTKFTQNSPVPFLNAPEDELQIWRDCKPSLR